MPPLVIPPNSPVHADGNAVRADAFRFGRAQRPNDRTEFPPLPSPARQGTLAAQTGEGSLAILSSTVDVNAAEFRANAERMRALVAELQARRAEAAAGRAGSARASAMWRAASCCRATA